MILITTANKKLAHWIAERKAELYLLISYVIIITVVVSTWLFDQNRIKMIL
jgi:hypothetical protein